MTNTESLNSEAATTTQVCAVVSCMNEQCLAPGILCCHEHSTRQFMLDLLLGDTTVKQYLVVQISSLVLLFLSNSYVSNYSLVLCLIIVISKITEARLLHG